MHLCTVNVRHTLSCTRLSKITDKGEGVPHLRVAGRRAWARTWKGPLTFCIIYTKQQDKHFKHSFLKRKIDFESTQLARQVQPITGCLCCHTYCAQLRPPWATIVGVLRAVSNREFRYPRVCWRFLSHPLHLSAFFLPRVTPWWPRNSAVCHVIIFRNACIHVRPGLKSVSGPQTRRSSTWISSSF